MSKRPSVYCNECDAQQREVGTGWYSAIGSPENPRFVPFAVAEEYERDGRLHHSDFRQDFCGQEHVHVAFQRGLDSGSILKPEGVGK